MGKWTQELVVKLRYVIDVRVLVVLVIVVTIKNEKAVEMVLKSTCESS